MKVLFIAPHLSTGGMPAFLLKRIQALKQYTNIEIFVIEWGFYSPTFIVQRKQIQELLGDNFHSFLGDKNLQKTIVEFCRTKQIDIVHIEEVPEGFDSFNTFDIEVQKELYDPSNPWKIVETCHNVYFDPERHKILNPDAYACVTPLHVKKTFKNKPGYKFMLPFPIDPSIQTFQTREEILIEDGWMRKGEYHIVNIGLWTQGKNQGYAIKIAGELYRKYGFTYNFHFIGNQAPNFKEYWEPLMENLPPNVHVYGERSDTNRFLKMADLMLFTSTWECNPIVLKEAISNNLKIMAFNLKHYGDEYKDFIVPLSGNLTEDKLHLIDTIHSPTKYQLKDYEGSVKEFALKHIELYQNLIDSGNKRK